MKNVFFCNFSSWQVSCVGGRKSGELLTDSNKHFFAFLIIILILFYFFSSVFFTLMIQYISCYVNKGKFLYISHISETLFLVLMHI